MSACCSILLALLFAAGTLFSGVFWIFLSDRGGFRPEDEPRIAEILNREYRNGDIIFPSPDWDIGFTRYLRDGITDISYTLTAFTREEIGDLNNNGVNYLWFVTDGEERWKSIRQRFGLTEYERFPVGKALVVKAQSSEKGAIKLLDLVDTIEAAKEVYLTDEAGAKKPCWWEQDRWRCGPREWQYVGQHYTLMAGRWQKALWAHPYTRKTLHLVFENTVGARTLVLGTSFLERAYREENGKPVVVTVTVDGAEVLRYTNQNIKERYRHRIALPEGARMIDIGIWVVFDGARHFVVNGYLAP